MESINICYTPLDVPIRPDVDITKFLAWIKKVYPQRVKKLARHSESQFPDNYPWDLVYACYFGLWQNDFDKEFPELAEYCYTAFGILREELLTVTFLPIRPNMRGQMFWHTDTDPLGLRFYLECEQHESNPLSIRKIVNPTNKFPMLSIPLEQDNDPRLQSEVYHCKMISPHQAFYLNNYKAVHAPLITNPAVRIAVFVSVKREYLDDTKKRIGELVLRSAEKYKDFAIVW